MNRFRSVLLLCSLLAPAPIAAQAANPAISDPLTVAGVTFNTRIPTPDWHLINPSTSVCERAKMSPRAYSAALRSGDVIVEMKVFHFDSTGDVGIVETRWTQHGEKRTLTFYASAGVCQSALALRVQKGEILPPGVN